MGCALLLRHQDVQTFGKRADRLPVPGTICSECNRIERAFRYLLGCGSEDVDGITRVTGIRGLPERGRENSKSGEMSVKAPA